MTKREQKMAELAALTGLAVVNDPHFSATDYQDAIDTWKKYGS